MSKMNILVVGGACGAPVTPEKIPADEKYNVVTVADGYGAIEEAKQGHYDVILLDGMLPGVDGMQTFRKIREIDSRVAVIMMTACSVADRLKETMVEGGCVFAGPPLDIDKIIRVIAESLCARRLILVFDRRFDDRETLRVMLENRGYTVAAAGDIAEAGRIAGEKPQDIIFLDADWPEIGGYYVFEMLQGIHPRVVVIMMTGYSQAELVIKAIETSTCACIYRPFDIQNVMACLNIMARKEASCPGPANYHGGGDG